MKYALIENGIVAQVEEVSEADLNIHAAALAADEAQAEAAEEAEGDEEQEAPPPRAKTRIENLLDRGFIEAGDDVFPGYEYEGGEFSAPAVHVPIEKIRLQRDALLRSSDWTQLPDSPLSSEAKDEWAQYRQALRDITDDFEEGDEIEWPESP